MSTIGVASKTDQLIQLLAEGKLVPVTRLQCLKALAPATRCRLALRGKIPSLRIGNKILCNEEMVVEALRGFAIQAPPAPAKVAPKVTARTPERLAQIAQARANNLKRGLPG